MRKHATKIWEVSFAVDCKTKIVKCGYAAEENFEMKIIVLPFSCISVNRSIGKGNIQELKRLEFYHLERYEWCKVNFCIPCFQFCLRVEAVMAVRFSFVIEGIKETLEWFQ